MHGGSYTECVFKMGMDFFKSSGTHVGRECLNTYDDMDFEMKSPNSVTISRQLFGINSAWE